ncbi:MAG: MFS transporter, partial [Clostridia bacterium]
LGGSILLPMMVVGLQPLADIITTMIGGGITDRIGRKPVILVSLLMQAAAIGGFMFADSVAAFAVLYMVIGVGRSLYIPAQRAQIADAVSDAQRPEVLSLLSTAGYLGQSLGPVLGVLIYKYNPTILFGLDALAIALYTLLIWRKTVETAPGIKAVSIEEASIRGAASSDAAFQASGHRHKRFNLRAALAEHRYVLLLMASSLPISFFYAQSETTLRLHLQQHFVEYVAVIAGLTTAKAIMAVTLELWLVKKTERLSLATIIMIATAGFMLASLGYGFATSFAVLLLAQLAVIVGESIGLTHMLNHVARIAPADKRGLYFSLYGIHWDISRTVGPVMGGWVLLKLQGEWLFALTALLILAGGLVQRRLVRS